MCLATFQDVADRIGSLGPSNFSAVETQSRTVYFRAEIGPQVLHVSLMFDENTGRFEEVVANVFADKRQKLNVFGTVADVFDSVTNYFRYERE